jgi:hypothetical protein
MVGARGADRILERCDVIVPQRAFAVIGFADLPGPLRILQSLGEARANCSSLLMRRKKFRIVVPLSIKPVSNSRLRS